MDERTIVEAQWKYLLLLIGSVGFEALLSLGVSAHMSWQQITGLVGGGLFIGCGVLVALLEDYRMRAQANPGTPLP